MSPEKLSFLVINVTGGVAVLGSYALWLANPSNDAAALWGSISGAARTLYTVSMLAAAAGYFAFAGYLLADHAGPSWSIVLTLFALILFPSALWMPLAFEYLRAPSPALWWSMRITLLLVGLSSLGLVIALLRFFHGGIPHTLAVAGAVAFTLQTLLLDALVWPHFFPR